MWSRFFKEVTIIKTLYNYKKGVVQRGAEYRNIGSGAGQKHHWRFENKALGLALVCFCLFSSLSRSMEGFFCFFFVFLLNRIIITAALARI